MRMLEDNRRLTRGRGCIRGENLGVGHRQERDRNDGQKGALPPGPWPARAERRVRSIDASLPRGSWPLEAPALDSLCDPYRVMGAHLLVGPGLEFNPGYHIRLR